jgi:hypothetical protein
MTGRRQTVATLVALLSLGAPYCATADDGATNSGPKGAKGLFFAQLEKPTENLNTGMRYWIELTRKGQSEVAHVSNKQQFHTGDQIRFHVRPNIDGFAYIVLRSGSRGEQAVLFPDSARGDNNRVSRGEDYILPADGAFEFDKNPGMEKLTILLSRTAINAQAYLSKPADQPVVIASAITGSKDLVPSQVFVAYAIPHEPVAPPHVTEHKHVIAVKPATPSLPQTISDDSNESKAPKHHKTVPHTTTTTTVSKHETIQKTAASLNDDTGVTTVIKKSADGVLFVNLELDHRS